MNRRALQILKNYFGYDSFRAGQESIINTILEGRDALAIMPTGAGKSICYQVPALMLEGITVVISPLISLMQDQVKALNAAGINAAYINSTLSEAQISQALRYAEQGRYKIIYVAPERLESGWFLRFATNTKISMVTVDEAHCISQWGQDFRPSYLKIVDFINGLPKRPIISAFTATATEEVKNDIICTLGLDNPEIVVTGFDRENLYYSVENIRKKDDYIVEYISKHPNESGIIYCATRKNVEKVFELLFKRGVSVTKYHAGLDAEERKRNQEDFIYDRTSLIVATNAFGMGIDKSNVRYVIHYNMPQSIENYYQEAGRAGRDGGASRCVLLFSAQDVVIEKFLLDRKEFLDVNEEDIELLRQRDMKRLRAMENYCKTTGCLRNYILDYFGERTYGPCDNCGNCHREYKETDMTVQAKWVINCVYETRGRYGLSVVLGTLLGADRAKLREIGATEYKSYGALKNCNEAELRLLINQMVQEGYLYQTEDKYSLLKMGPEMDKLRNPDTHIVVRTYEEKEPAIRRTREYRARSTDSLTTAGFELFEILRALRLEIARQEAVPPYIIFSDKTLIDMCLKMPQSEAKLLSVNGVGRRKAAKYGEQFLSAIKEYEAKHPGVKTGEPLAERGSDGSINKTVGVHTGAGTYKGGTAPAEERINAGAYIRDGVYAAADTEAEAKKKKHIKAKKEEFYITPEQAEEFLYGEMYYISEIKDHLNELRDAAAVKGVTLKAIWEMLVNEGLTFEENRNGIFIKTATDKGLQAGIEIIRKINEQGFMYEVLRYPENVQRLIVEYFTL